MRAYPENDAKSAEQDDNKLAKDKVRKVSVIVLGTNQSHAHVRTIECARLCDHGIAICRTKRRQEACEGQRRQGHSAGGSFTAAALVPSYERKGAPPSSASPVGSMFHVACYSLLLQLDPANLAEATVTIARSFLRPLLASTVLLIRGHAYTCSIHVATSSVLWLPGLLRRMRTGKMRPQLRGDEALRSSDGVCRLAPPCRPCRPNTKWEVAVYATSTGTAIRRLWTRRTPGSTPSLTTLMTSTSSGVIGQVHASQTPQLLWHRRSLQQHRSSRRRSANHRPFKIKRFKSACLKKKTK